MAATTGKGVNAVLNRKVMDKNALPESLKEYAEKLDKENHIDYTEMFMALGKSDAAMSDRIDSIERYIHSIERYIRRPWWRKLFGID